MHPCGPRVGAGFTGSEHACCGGHAARARTVGIGGSTSRVPAGVAVMADVLRVFQERSPDSRATSAKRVSQRKLRVPGTAQRPRADGDGVAAIPFRLL